MAPWITALIVLSMASAYVVSFCWWLLIGLFVDPDRFVPLASRIGSVIATMGRRIRYVISRSRAFQSWTDCWTRP